MTRPLSDVVSDGYIAIFSVVMLGSMLVSVLVNVAGLSDQLCTSSGCRAGRSLLPHLVAAGALAMVLSVSRMFGPVFASPAVSAWLLTTPADRGGLLRPRIWRTAMVSALVTGLLAAAATTLGGFGGSAIAGYSVLAAVLAVAAVALAALSQAGNGRVARVVTWLLAAALWATLLLLALARAPRLGTPASLSPLAVSLGAVAALAAAVLVALSLRTTPRLHRRDVAAGGSLAPGLSGAMASLDLALMYDVLLGHRWRARGSVHSRRGTSGAWGQGLGALVRTDLIRLLRSPQWPLLVAASVVVPHAVGVAGGERITFLVAALLGFLTGLPLLSSLRVLTRSPAIQRMMPFPVSATRQASLVVPLVILLLHGLATTPVLHDVLDLDWPAALLCGIASGMASLAAAARWVTGRPPDFGRPLVSSPAGGIPTNLYGSVLRGFDVLLLAAAPVLLAPGAFGAVLSICVSLVVLGYLAGRA